MKAELSKKFSTENGVFSYLYQFKHVFKDRSLLKCQGGGGGGAKK